MNRRIVAVLMLALLVLGLFAGCQEESEVISQEDAVAVVLEELGKTEDEVTAHVHVTTHEGMPCWGVYVTVDGQTYLYAVHCETAEILSVQKSDHSH